MTKDLVRRCDDEFVVQHLADPNDWVADHERTSCQVCSRAFGTFRRKHHCRMCGEVVCSGCTLHKNALIATIGQTRVRVCISCIFTHGETQKGGSRPYSPRMTSPTTLTSEESRRWLSNHLHSPLSKWDNDYEDPATSPSSADYEDNNNQRDHSSCSNNQDTNEHGNPLNDTTAWTHPWPRPPVPYDELDRLEALYSLQVLDSAPEKAYDMICDLAKARLACPMAAVSFMDEHRQWFKSSVGLAHKMIPRKIAFCAYTIVSKEPMVVLDTLKDKRFECNPLVSGAAAVRFYAAAPIIDRHTGHAIGSVFVLDTRPRESCDLALLERLARVASENLPDNVDDSPELTEEQVEQLKQRHVQEQHRLHQQPRAAPVHPLPMPATSPAKPQQLLQVQPRSEPQPPQQLVVQAPVAPLPASHSGSDNQANLSTALSASSSATGESMEVLLMRLLTQNTETQQQLASQQLSLNSTISGHSVQINKLMTDFARMEAKIDAKMKSK